MGRGGGGGESVGLPCRLSWLQTWLCTCVVGATFVVLAPWRNQNATQSLRARGSRGQEAFPAGLLAVVLSSGEGELVRCCWRPLSSRALGVSKQILQAQCSQELELSAP